MINQKKEWILVQHTTPSEIAQFLNKVFEIYEVRGRVGTINGIEFSVRTNEGNHSIPHVHAKYAEHYISIAIEDGTVLAGNLPNKNMKQAVEWVLLHKVELKEKWDNIAISAISPMTRSNLDRPSDD